jgi:LacI family transcriptional regulator
MIKKRTIKDIAKVAKVSAPAVSMVLRNHPRIGFKTRQRILKIAKRMNYQPNFIARSLVTKKTKTIGLIITSILNPFYPELAKGVEDKAMELGYQIILCSTNYDLKLEKYFINDLQNRGVDGIIFSSVEVHDPNIQSLTKDKFPFILINRRTYNKAINKKSNYIILNNVLGGYIATEHLYRLGHHRIGIIAGDFNASTAIERLEGTKKFFKKAKMQFDNRLVVEARFSKELAYQRAKQILTMKNPPTAIFAQNDYMALGAREAILDLGFKIPEDIALIGCDNISISGLKGIEITTIGQKKYEMGKLGAEILIERIENENSGKVRQIMLEPDLIIRNSCGFKLCGYQYPHR